MRAGYQVSVDIVVHRRNMTDRLPQRPVIVLFEVLPDDAPGWKRTVDQVRFTGPAWTEYGWGTERAHNRGARFGAAIWIYTESPVEYRDEEGWHVAP